MNSTHLAVLVTGEIELDIAVVVEELRVEHREVVGEAVGCKACHLMRSTQEHETFTHGCRESHAMHGPHESES